MILLILLFVIYSNAIEYVRMGNCQKDEKDGDGGFGLISLVEVKKCAKHLYTEDPGKTHYVKYECNDTHVVSHLYNDSSCSNLIKTDEIAKDSSCYNGNRYQCVQNISTYHPMGEWVGDSGCSGTTDLTMLYPDGACFGGQNGTSAILSCDNQGNITYKNFTSKDCSGDPVIVVSSRPTPFCFSSYGGNWKMNCPTYDSGEDWIEKTLFADDVCATKGMIFKRKAGECSSDLLTHGTYVRNKCFGNEVLVETYKDNKCLFKISESVITDGNCSEKVKIECKTSEPSYPSLLSAKFYETKNCSNVQLSLWVTQDVCMEMPKGPEKKDCDGDGCGNFTGNFTSNFTANYTNDPKKDENRGPERMKFKCVYSHDTTFFVMFQYQNSTTCDDIPMMEQQKDSKGGGPRLIIVNNTCGSMEDDKCDGPDCEKKSNDTSKEGDNKNDAKSLIPNCPSKSAPTKKNYAALQQYTDETCGTLLGATYFAEGVCAKSMFNMKEYMKCHCTDGGVVMRIFNDSACAGKSKGMLFKQDTCGFPGKTFKFSCMDTKHSEAYGIYDGEDATCSGGKLSDLYLKKDTCIDTHKLFNLGDDKKCREEDKDCTEPQEQEFSEKVGCFYSSNGKYYYVKGFPNKDCTIPDDNMNGFAIAHKDGDCARLSFEKYGGKCEGDCKEDKGMWGGVRHKFTCADQTLPAKKDYVISKFYGESSCSGDVAYKSIWKTGTCMYNVYNSKYMKVECGANGILASMFSDSSCTSYENSFMWDFDVCDSDKKMKMECANDDSLTGEIKFSLYDKPCDDAGKNEQKMAVVSDKCIKGFMGDDKSGTKIDCVYTSTKDIFLIKHFNLSADCSSKVQIRVAAEDEKCFDFGEKKRREEGGGPKAGMGVCPTPISRAPAYEYAYKGYMKSSTCQAFPDLGIAHEPEKCVPGPGDIPQHYSRLYCLGEKHVLEMLFKGPTCKTIEYFGAVEWKTGICDDLKSGMKQQFAGCFNKTLHANMIQVTKYNSDACKVRDKGTAVSLYKSGHCFSEDKQQFSMGMCVKGLYFKGKWKDKGGCNGTPDKIDVLAVDKCVKSGEQFFKIKCADGKYDGVDNTDDDGNAGNWWEKAIPTDPDKKEDEEKAMASNIWFSITILISLFALAL